MSTNAPRTLQLTAIAITSELLLLSVFGAIVGVVVDCTTMLSVGSVLVRCISRTRFALFGSLANLSNTSGITLPCLF